MKGMHFEGFPSSSEKTKPNSGPSTNSGYGTGGAKTKAGNVFKGEPDATGRLTTGKAPRLTKDGTTYG